MRRHICFLSPKKCMLGRSRFRRRYKDNAIFPNHTYASKPISTHAASPTPFIALSACFAPNRFVIVHCVAWNVVIYMIFVIFAKIKHSCTHKHTQTKFTHPTFPSVTLSLFLSLSLSFSRPSCQVKSPFMLAGYTRIKQMESEMRTQAAPIFPGGGV